jgi:hypothetical protein
MSQQGPTNDVGEYRITGLPAGHYYIHAESSREGFVEEQGKPEKRLMPAFYPDSQTPTSANLVEVPAGEDLAGINVVMRTADTFHVRGKLDSQPSGDSHPSVVAMRNGSEWRNWPAASSEVERDGLFEIEGLQSGAYQLHVTGDSMSAYSSGSLPIEIKGSDLNGTVIPVMAAVEFSGTIHFDGVTDRVIGDAIMLIEADTGLTSNTFGTVKEDGSFRASAPPGRYIISLAVGPNDYVKSISYAGQEVLGQPIDLSQGSAGGAEVVVVKGACKVAGSISTSSPEDSSAMKEAVRGAEIALVSDRTRFDSAGAFVTQSDQTGHFSLSGVPPGKYYAFASKDVPAGLWQNRDFFGRIRGDGVEVSCGNLEGVSRSTARSAFSQSRVENWENPQVHTNRNTTVVFLAIELVLILCQHDRGELNCR